MKSQTIKILIIIALTAIVTAFITCILCKPKDVTNVPDKDRSATICMDYQTEPPAVLTSELVKSMVTRYSDAQLNNIQNAAVNNVPKDARSIWFDLETLKKFLYQIEYNASKNPSKIQNKSLGVRIYYAAYPENDKMRQYSQTQAQGFSFNPNYEKLHTLVMIPTITDKESENHYDFNPLDVNSYVGFVNMNRDNRYAFINSNYPILTLGPGAEETTNAQGISSQVSARNHGSLTPPDTFEGLGF
jgi:hypothetical protein